LYPAEIGRREVEIVRSQLFRGGLRSQHDVIHSTLHAAVQKVEVDADDHAQDEDGCEDATHGQGVLFSQPVLKLGWILLKRGFVGHSRS